MGSHWSRRGLAAAAALACGLAARPATAGVLFPKHHATYVQAPTAAAAPAYYAQAPAAAPIAYAPAPVAAAPAPAYYVAAPAPAPAYYLAPAHGHHHKSVVVAPYAPQAYAYPQYTYPTAAAPYAPAPYAPAPYAPAPYATAAAAPYGPTSTAPAPAAPVNTMADLNLPPSARDVFLEDLRKTYTSSDSTDTGLARITALRAAAQERYKAYRDAAGTDSAELTQGQKDKLDSLVDQVIRDERDRVTQTNSRYAADAAGYPYPTAPYMYGYRPAYVRSR